MVPIDYDDILTTPCIAIMSAEGKEKNVSTTSGRGYEGNLTNNPRGLNFELAFMILRWE